MEGNKREAHCAQHLSDLQRNIKLLCDVVKETSVGQLLLTVFYAPSELISCVLTISLDKWNAEEQKQQKRGGGGAAVNNMLPSRVNNNRSQILWVWLAGYCISPTTRYHFCVNRTGRRQKRVVMERRIKSSQGGHKSYALFIFKESHSFTTEWNRPCLNREENRR